MQSNSRIIRNILAIALCLALFSILAFVRQISGQPNALAVGASARSNTKIKIPIYRPVSLSGLGVQEILGLRREMVQAHPVLIDGGYEPAGEVFGRLEDRAPWYSLTGHYAYPTGENAVSGPSYESRFVVNPYNLVGVEFWGLTGWGRSGFKWDKRKVNPEIISNPHFPLYCKPAEMDWYPKESSLVVKYNLKDFIDRVGQFTKNSVAASDIDFGLISYNARDFGYQYMHVDLKKSRGISMKYKKEQVSEIGDSIVRSHRCYFKGGCMYHESPNSKNDYFTLDSLPASVNIKLWKNNPTALSQQEDLTIYLKFN